MELFSNVQILEEQSKTKSSNKNTCEKPSEPYGSFYMFPTTTQTMPEEEGLLNLDLENFPMSVIEVMLFKLEVTGEIAAQTAKSCRIHTIKTNALKS